MTSAVPARQARAEAPTERASRSIIRTSAIRRIPVTSKHLLCAAPDQYPSTALFRRVFRVRSRPREGTMSVGVTYVIFDGDKDRYAFAFMRGWKVNDRVEFDFRDAHDIGAMTARASDENYVKSEL